MASITVRVDRPLREMPGVPPDRVSSPYSSSARLMKNSFSNRPKPWSDTISTVAPRSAIASRSPITWSHRR